MRAFKIVSSAFTSGHKLQTKWTIGKKNILGEPLRFYQQEIGKYKFYKKRSFPKIIRIFTKMDIIV